MLIFILELWYLLLIKIRKYLLNLQIEDICFSKNLQCMYSVMSNVHIFSKQVIIFYQYRLSNKLLTTYYLNYTSHSHLVYIQHNSPKYF